MPLAIGIGIAPELGGRAGGAVAVLRADPYRVAVFGDSLGQRTHTLLGLGAKYLTGQVLATAASTATASGTLTIDSRTYAVTNGDSCTTISNTINADASATVVASVGDGTGGSFIGGLVLTSKTWGTNIVFTLGTVTGLSIPSSPSYLAANTYDGSQTSPTNPNPVSFLWDYEYTDQSGSVDWGVNAWLGPVSGGKYIVPHQLNRAVGGSNTGQCAAYSVISDRLKQLISVLTAEASAGRPVHAVVIPLSTNDAAGNANFTVAQSFNNLVFIAQTILAAFPAMKIVQLTAGARGNGRSGTTDGNQDGTTRGYRLLTSGGTGALPNKLQFARDLRDKLISDYESTVGASAKVLNCWLHSVATTPVTNEPGSVSPGTINGVVYIDGDILEPYCYTDALHWGPILNPEIALLIKAKLDLLLTATVSNHLPTATNDNTNMLGTVGTMQGTTGTVTVAGNATTNGNGATPFTLNGHNSGTTSDSNVATGWDWATIAGWNATTPKNVAGTITITQEAAAVGNSIGNATKIVAALTNNGTATSTNTRTFEGTVAIDPSVAQNGITLSAGDWFEYVVAVELSNVGVDFRGVDIEMRLSEAGTARTVRALQTLPNGSFNMGWDPARSYVAGSYLYLQTMPWQLKSGSYAGTKLAVVFSVGGAAGQPADNADFIAKVSQAMLRKVAFT